MLASGPFLDQSGCQFGILMVPSWTFCARYMCCATICA